MIADRPYIAVRQLIATGACPCCDQPAPIAIALPGFDYAGQFDQPPRPTGRWLVACYCPLHAQQILENWSK